MPSWEMLAPSFLSGSGLTDAEILENEFRPEISALDLIGLPNYHIYLKLMIDGKVSSPFSAATIRLSD